MEYLENSDSAFGIVLDLYFIFDNSSFTENNRDNSKVYSNYIYCKPTATSQCKPGTTATVNRSDCLYTDPGRLNNNYTALVLS